VLSGDFGSLVEKKILTQIFIFLHKKFRNPIHLKKNEISIFCLKSVWECFRTYFRRIRVVSGELGPLVGEKS